MMQGVSLIPVRVNAALLILLIYVFHYIYRFVSIREIGECGRPLYEQLGIKLHWVIRNIFDGIFLLTMPVFPTFLIIFSAIELFGISNYKNNPNLLFITLIITAPLSVMSWVIYINQRERTTPVSLKYYPKPSSEFKKALTLYIIPVLAMFTGCSLSIFSYSFYNQMGDPSAFFYSPEISPFLFMSFFVFIPFRYLIMRTAGASLISAVSFLLSIVFIVSTYITEIYII